MKIYEELVQEKSDLAKAVVSLTSAKQQISGGLSILLWAFLLASQDQTRHENAKSMNCAMLGIWLLMPLFKYNNNIDIG